MHLLSTDTDRILLDCGMFQGRRKQAEQKNKVLPFDPAIVSNMILSHAHIDHSGRVPLLAKFGFNGRIVTTRVTRDACRYMLPDSAHIQESDAEYLNYKTVRNALYRMNTSQKKGQVSKRKQKKIRKMLKHNKHGINKEAVQDLIGKYRLEGVEPLYTSEDAAHALSLFEGQPYRRAVTVGKGMTCKFYEAGHILGSAVSILRYQGSDGRTLSVAYTGDLGRFDKPILRDPALQFDEEDRNIDLLIMESTYGDRLHDPVVDLKPRLKTIIEETHRRGGCVVIPCFAYGRTQELVYVIHELFSEGEVETLPVYVDSPLATHITRVFGEHPEVYDLETHETFLQKGKNPFLFDQITFVKSVEESMALNRDNKSHIVISASGMCEAGRILHHLRYRIHDPRNTILIVGFMAQHTLGRRLMENGLDYEAAGRKGDVPIVKILNKTYPLKARVKQLGGFSAHADKNELRRFLKQSNLQIKRIALVHGEETQTLSLAEDLKADGFDTFVPRAGESLRVG
jgi:metallo-beta-lactamase family protein